ncbi:MAG: alkaline phosphatase [Vicinamibacteria bacterium]|nr:alkaline phosphatase [Vicinamibacteria bacterium]
MVTAESLGRLLGGEPKEAWAEVFSLLWKGLSAPVEAPDVAAEMIRRDKSFESLDILLSGAAWDLWLSFEESVESTADALAAWWDSASGGRAVLILDALSLRETPWILGEAAKRGYTVKSARPTASALPSDTTSFARALGLPQRSSLSAGSVPSLRLAGAATAFFEQPWRECADTLPNAPDVLAWHDWPDSLMHDLSGAGPGLRQLAEDARKVLVGDDFWHFVDRMATGRRLVITSDHGYAASGLFADVPDDAQKTYFQQTFGAERHSATPGAAPSHWLPPVDLHLQTARGPHRFALGRRGWRVQSGRKNLSHGGLSVLETAVPFIELTKTGSA